MDFIKLTNQFGNPLPPLYLRAIMINEVRPDSKGSFVGFGNNHGYYVTETVEQVIKAMNEAGEDIKR